MYITLTVGDNRQNGCIYLARWNIESRQQGLKTLSDVDQTIEDEAAGDPDKDPFFFILDLFEDETEQIGTNSKCLPLQLASRLAPEQVSSWLDKRPNPDRIEEKPPLILDEFPDIMGSH
ncbi:hypothetical protein [Pseudovibrio sp. Ad37]|uniref:hypothetical protein n=1 Tax=Pseudovibrio sp. Ad37 TaxID=989422 RepID=UPI0007AEA4C1|nr:hypothetical protein [Pseudovibrio sp. Ad37]KZL24243.1 hypothetical protein PsAD37_02814 [Pseudovibrio sp. Ad37]